MKNILLLVVCFLTAQFSKAQNAETFYKKADSLYKLKEFKSSANAYSNGMKMMGNIVNNRTYLQAASSWSMAGEADSAFSVLGIVAKSNKVSKTDLYQVEYGIEYDGLHKDRRWKPLLENTRLQVEKNGYTQEEIIYGRKDGMGLTLVRVSPKLKSNGKAIIYVISGGWNSFYNGIAMNTEAAEQFLAKGYTVFAVMHGSQPRYPIPDAVNDIKRAVRFIRFNASKYNIDPDHIGITGTSAGGHLSLMVAVSDDKPNLLSPDPVERQSARVQAVAVLFPPTDLLNWGGSGLNMVNAKDLLKAARTWGAVDFKSWNEKFRIYEEITDTAERNKIGREVSPLYFVSADDPPVFIIHGDADPTVPLQQSQSIIARFNEASVPNRFIIKKGGRHNGDQMNPEWQEFAKWFDKYLK